MKREQKEYGWKSTKPPCSCGFVAPCVLNILKLLDVKRVLDVGCGNGALCGMLHDAGFDVVGADADKNGCALARAEYPDILFFEVGVYDEPDPVLGNPPKKFDCVVSTEVVEHLYAPRHLPQFASRVLRQNGYLVLSTPYHGYLKNLALSVFNHWEQHHTALWEGGHIKFWSKKTLTQLLHQNGFKVTQFYGVGRFPYLWKSMILVAQKMS